MAPSRETKNPAWSAERLPVTPASGTRAASNPATKPIEAKRDSETTPSSRSEGIEDGVGNLNRWSESTTASTDSSAGAKEDLIGPRQAEIAPPASPPDSRTLPVSFRSPYDSINGTLLFSDVTPMSAEYGHKVPPKTHDFQSRSAKDHTNEMSPVNNSSDGSYRSAAVTVNGPGTKAGLSSSLAKGNLGTSHSFVTIKEDMETHTSETHKVKARDSKSPSHKMMLSDALKRANKAVLLDNAQDFSGAVRAYAEAIGFLELVMPRSSTPEDRQKLEAIRNTYESRILEIKNSTLQPPKSNTEPSDPPPASMKHAQRPQHPQRRDSLQKPAYVRAKKPTTGVAGVVRGAEDPRQDYQHCVMHVDRGPSAGVATKAIPAQPTLARRSSLMRTAHSDGADGPSRTGVTQQTHGRPLIGNHRPSSSNESPSQMYATRQGRDPTVSLIDPALLRTGRKWHNDAEGGFDAALNAAVDAAYDDDDSMANDLARPLPVEQSYDNEVVLNARRKVEAARERVRQTERDAAIQLARDRERMRILMEARDKELLEGEEVSGESDSEAEEHLFEEMIRGHDVFDAAGTLRDVGPAIPPKPDHSARERLRVDAATGLAFSNSAELAFHARSLPAMPSTVELVHPKQYQALPSPPRGPQSSQPISGQGALPGSSLDRMQHGHSQGHNRQPNDHAKNIPTYSRPLVQDSHPIATTGAKHKTPSTISKSQHLDSASGNLFRPSKAYAMRQSSSPLPSLPALDISSPSKQVLSMSIEQDSRVPPSENLASPLSSVADRDFSTTSLPYLGEGSYSISTFDGATDFSPTTPNSTLLSRDQPRQNSSRSSLPTKAAIFEPDSYFASSDMALFDHDFHELVEQGLAPQGSSKIPEKVEPCPKEFLLRPFWFMRAIHRTLTHPRGCYLSEKLFIPSSIWEAKRVKFKGLDDKISNCDFLTSALQKLSRVDTYDADAVLDEMQALETVLEQVQAALTKKLGNEVGIHGSGMPFKDHAPLGDPEPLAGSKPTSGSRSFSWKRLRSKSSGVGLAGSYASRTTSQQSEVMTKNITMSSIPIVEGSSARYLKLDDGQANFFGPNATYMNALAKLFEAVQVIDQIARQVEDPGLRHADKTQVGLELSTRHAAEFFGFYICRFVLTDVGILLDKHIKRGGENVNT